MSESHVQRAIWEVSCPALLEDRDRLYAALDELLEIAVRIRGGDRSLDPEQWYATRDYARVALNKSANLSAASPSGEKQPQ